VDKYWKLATSRKEKVTEGCLLDKSWNELKTPVREHPPFYTHAYTWQYYPLKKGTSLALHPGTLQTDKGKNFAKFKIALASVSVVCLASESGGVSCDLLRLKSSAGSTNVNAMHKSRGRETNMQT